MFLERLSQASIDFINEAEENDQYKVHSVLHTKRNVGFWERWGGWYIFLITDAVCDVFLGVAKSFPSSILISILVIAATIGIFVGGALWYLKWFEKILGRTYVVNLIEKESENGEKGKEGTDEVSNSESNS